MIVVPVPVRFPFSTRVLVMAAISIRVAYPPSIRSVYPLGMMFRLAPAFITVSVTGDADTMIPIRVAAFVSVGYRLRREKRRGQGQTHGRGEKCRLRTT